MPTAYRSRLHRLVLSLAAMHNLAYGVWVVGWPQSFFVIFDMQPPRYPGIWQCLGMVIGLYGVGYGYAACRPERARPFVAIGLAGKVLGPLGWLLAVNSGEWPARTFTLVMFNDIVWWLPFTLILLEGTHAGERVRRAAPYACAALNAVGTVALLVALRGGSEVVTDLVARSAYIAQHPFLWRGGWMVWVAAAQSLLAFYAWWGVHLPAYGWGVAAVLVGMAGHACDVLALSLYVGWLPPDLETIGPLGTLLTGVMANGLYTVAGIILTVGTALRGPLLAWTWAVWGTGLGVSASAIAGSTTGMVVSTAIMMPLFCPWAIVMGRRLLRSQP